MRVNGRDAAAKQPNGTVADCYRSPWGRAQTSLAPADEVAWISGTSRQQAAQLGVASRR